MVAERFSSMLADGRAGENAAAAAAGRISPATEDSSIASEPGAEKSEAAGMVGVRRAYCAGCVFSTCRLRVLFALESANADEQSMQRRLSPSTVNHSFFMNMKGLGLMENMEASTHSSTTNEHAGVHGGPAKGSRHSMAQRKAHVSANVNQSEVIGHKS